MAKADASEPAAEAAMMRRWARHWLRSCRQMPVRALAVLDRGAPSLEKRVHEFRRLMKAWRALLRLAPARLAEGAGEVRADVGRLRRAFGAARDATVIAAALKRVGFERIPPAEEAAVEAGKLLREQGDAVRAELRRLSAAMEQWSVAGETGDFLVLAYRRSYRRARRGARRDPRRMGLKRLHRWRSAVVDLGYQCGFFQSSGSARLRKQAEAAERLRTHLGHVFDLDLARNYLAGAPAGEDDARVLHRIEREIGKRRRKAARLADRLLDRRPRSAGAHLRTAMERNPPPRTRLA